MLLRKIQVKRSVILLIKRIGVAGKPRKKWKGAKLNIGIFRVWQWTSGEINREGKQKERRECYDSSIEKWKN